MAHSTLHFALGLAAGTAVLLPGLAKKIRRREDVSVSAARWLVFAYAFGIFAIVPNLLRRIGVPDAVCTGWWMNLFLFHPLIDHIKEGGVLIAEVLILGCFGLQYLVILVALWQCVRSRSIPSTSDQHSC